MKKIKFILTIIALNLVFVKINVSALPLQTIDLNSIAGGQPGGVVTPLQILFLFATISIVPSLLVTMTAFTRIIISMYFVRSAIGTQQMPPNQVMIGLALFLTLFLMGPIFTTINDTAIKPYSAGEMTQEEFLITGMDPLREFMFRQVENKDMELFVSLSGETFETEEDIPNRILIPSFILGEITKGFKIGFLIYLPFLAIDMIVASVLMAMGMMMLPPAMISLPFKILLFVMADGWSLIIKNLMNTFR